MQLGGRAEALCHAGPCPRSMPAVLVSVCPARTAEADIQQQQDHVKHVHMLSSKGHQLYIPFRNFFDSSFRRLGVFYSPSTSLGPSAVPCTAGCPLHILTPGLISHL